MSHEELRCPRCGAGRVPGWHCPNCGYGGEEPDTFLLGSGAADGVAAVVAALISFVCLTTEFQLSWTRPGYPGGVGTMGVLLLAVESLLFFTVLRPYRTVRQAFAVTACLSTIPGALLAGCQSALGSPAIMGSQVVPGAGGAGYALVALALLALQVALIAAAFGRRR